MDLYIRVIPNAKLTELVEQKGNTMRIRLAAPPAEGKANKELVVFLSKHLGVKKSSIEIIHGLTSRDKLVRIYQ